MLPRLPASKTVSQRNLFLYKVSSLKNSISVREHGQIRDCVPFLGLCTTNQAAQTQAHTHTVWREGSLDQGVTG